MSHPAGIAASLALAPLLDGPRQPLHVLHRGRLGWQLGDLHGHVVCCVTFPGSLRLPHALAVPAPVGSTSSLAVGAGALYWGDIRIAVTRWWQPARPRWPGLRAHVVASHAACVVRTWRDSLGQGHGLTPYDDDVIVGSLVTLRAAGHPLSAGWSAQVLAAPLEDVTTAASAGLLRQAAHGVCLDEVAAVLAAYAEGGDPRDAEQRLLAVGASSGAGLLSGVRRLLGRVPSVPYAEEAVA